MKKKLNMKFRAMVSVLLIAVAMIFCSMSALADEEGYLATWDDYTASGAPSSTWNDVVDAMEDVLEYGREAYASGDADTAYQTVSDAYYGYYETTGFERIAMGYISGSRKTEMELQFSACKSVAKKGGTSDEYDQEVDLLESMLRDDANVLDGVSGDSEESEGSEDTGDAASDTADASSSNSSGGQRAASTATFLACFGIILREGFEAILIVGAIIAYLLKSSKGDENRKKKTVRPVYAGSLIGIVASFILAWLLNLLKLSNSASQEVIEGVTALIAVVVLYYVSNWMLSKSESDAWVSYIKGKALKSSGSVIALAFTAFLAVFREGAEVVLFFQPMLAGGNISSVWWGFIVGCICLVVVYLVIHLMSVRIPIRPFFTGTSILMFLMSISFLGAGIKELIEGDVITMSSPGWLSWIPSNNVMDVLGIYPCKETVIPQLILLGVTIVIFTLQTKKNNRIHRAAEARRQEEMARIEAEEARQREEEFYEKVAGIVRRVLAEEKLIAAPAEAAGISVAAVLPDGLAEDAKGEDDQSLGQEKEETRRQEDE